MINRWLVYGIGIALVLGLLIGVGAGWSVRDWKADADQLRQAEAARKAEKAASVAVLQPSVQFEKILADLRPAQIETRNTIREVYRDVKVPTDCAVPAAGVSLLEAARERANAAATGQSVPELRRAPESSPAVAGPKPSPVGG